jgi:TetR/AcrR family transcriptional repressor of nem operon
MTDIYYYNRVYSTSILGFRMGRSSRQQADDNRMRIVEVASGLFRAHGIETVGIADVMKAAGMTQGGFYKHFPSKDALAAEACAFAFAGAVEKWRSVASEAQQKGRDVAGALTDYYLTPKPPSWTCPMIALADDAARSSPDGALREAYAAGVRSLHDTFAELATADRDGISREDAGLRFAAMVGSNMLTRSAPGGRWIANFKKAMPSRRARRAGSISGG